MKAVILFSPLIRRIYKRLVPMRRSQFDLLPTPPDRVVFLGDSITEQGLWAEWFPELKVLNRGIGGDTVGGLIDRLGSAVNRPRAVCLMIGTNDLAGLGRSRKVEQIAAQLNSVLEQLRERAPDTALFVSRVLPRWTWLADDIESLNQLYRDRAVLHDATYIDLWPALATPERALRKELSGDGTQLNGAGYRVWVDILRPHLTRFADELVSTNSTKGDSDD